MRLQAIQEPRYISIFAVAEIRNIKFPFLSLVIIFHSNLPCAQIFCHQLLETTFDKQCSLEKSY